MSEIKKRYVAGVSPLGSDHTKKKPPATGGVQLKASITVDRPPEDCYRYWRDFTHLPNFLTHLESVVTLDERRSHWTVKAPADTTLEWDAEMITDKPPERISWRSLENAQVDNAGSVEFSPRESGHHTEVKVALTYNPALGRLGEWFSKLFGENADQQLEDDLVLFKDAVETQKDPRSITPGA